MNEEITYTAQDMIDFANHVLEGDSTDKEELREWTLNKCIKQVGDVFFKGKIMNEGDEDLI